MSFVVFECESVVLTVPVIRTRLGLLWVLRIIPDCLVIRSQYRYIYIYIKIFGYICWDLYALAPSLSALLLFCLLSLFFFFSFFCFGCHISDPSSNTAPGDIVTATESISGGLPKFQGNKGTISIEFILPRETKGSATFIVNGARTPSVELPEGAVVIPAACLLKKGQSVTVGPNLSQQPL